MRPTALKSTCCSSRLGPRPASRASHTRMQAAPPDMNTSQWLPMPPPERWQSPHPHPPSADSPAQTDRRWICVETQASHADRDSGSCMDLEYRVRHHDGGAAVIQYEGLPRCPGQREIGLAGSVRGHSGSHQAHPGVYRPRAISKPDPAKEAITKPRYPMNRSEARPGSIECRCPRSPRKDRWGHEREKKDFGPLAHT